MEKMKMIDDFTEATTARFKCDPNSTDPEWNIVIYSKNFPHLILLRWPETSINPTVMFTTLVLSHSAVASPPWLWNHPIYFKLSFGIQWNIPGLKLEWKMDRWVTSKWQKRKHWIKIIHNFIWRMRQTFLTLVFADWC